MPEPTDNTPEPAPVQNLTQLRAVGTALVNAGKAASDGVGLDDYDEAMAVATSTFNAADDFQVDFETAMEEVAAQILREVAAYRRAKKGIEAVE
jgi:hypothetical protein